MTDGFDLSGALGTFLEEARELLSQMEDILLRLEEDITAARHDDINAMFRAAHTVKGSAGLFGLDEIVDFGHEVETLLDQVRDDSITLDAAWISVLLECTDHLGALVEQAGEGEALGPALQEKGNGLIATLREGRGVAPEPEGEKASSDEGSRDGALLPVNRALEKTIKEWTTRPDQAGWHLSLRFGPETYRNGMDPLSFIRYLSSLGELYGVKVVPDQIPQWQEYDPETCYLGFEINFVGDVSKQTLEDVFEFVREDCELRILPTASKVESFLELIQALPEDNLRIGEILVQVGTLTKQELDAALNNQATSGQDEPLGQILVERGAVQAPVVEAAVEKQTRIKAAKTKESSTVRVQAEKLDALIDLVGELVIASSAVRMQGANDPDSRHHQSALEVSRLVELMREGTLRLRMVEIGDTFARFNRIVRDTARELGKTVKLVIEGGETELDRTMVEKIADPLTHMVRNAIDHGIESPESRRAAGKPEKGTIRLAAFHDSGNVVIEVSDDGAGLNPERIHAKALAKGLITEEDNLSEKAIYQLIFEPGFSTAEQISNLSGRGVGMDVVKQTVENLRGTIDVDSVQGNGTSVRLRLPLTLAIIDGFLMGAASAKFVLPLDMIVECIDLQGQVDPSRHGSYVKVRESVVPFVRIAEFFGLKREANRRESLVIVRCEGKRFGLVVDELLGEIQAVIKPLGELFNRLQGISGSTILGSGELALIIDVVGLAQLARKKEGQTVSSIEKVV